MYGERAFSEGSEIKAKLIGTEEVVAAKCLGDTKPRHMACRRWNG